MLDFIKNILGITSSDELKPNNQNSNECDEMYWAQLEQEWQDEDIPF